MFNIREYSVGQGRNGCRERTVRPSQFRAWSSPARIFSSNFYKNCWPYFENLRIPLDNAKILQQLASLADEIIAAKKQASCHPERTLEPKAIGEVEGSSEVLQVNKVPELAEGSSAAVEKCVSTLETQVNTLVYQLYDITDTEEIETVEKR